MTRKQPETEIHKAVVRHLWTRPTPGGVWFHPPNGGQRNIIEAVRFKSLGVRAGVSDIIALRNKEAFALELKAPGGRPTEAQLEFQSDFRAAGGHAVVAEGLDEALRILEAWNLLKRSA
jgi:hypothetical protein